MYVVKLGLCENMDIENWKTQLRKGYLELSILTLIESKERVYGFEILDVLSKAKLEIKEGTLYPLLNRMTLDGYLKSFWETENNKGHPRKFYSLTKQGSDVLKAMRAEFDSLYDILTVLRRKSK